jgi:phosphoserine phosphatase RsbU/P
MNMDDYFILIVSMLIMILITVVFTFALSKTRLFGPYVGGKLYPKNCLAMILTFGLLSIIATHYMSANYNSALISIRDMPPLVAGLIGGPITGIGAGLIGGAERYTEGGVTAIPCSLGPILSGLIGGIVWYIAGKRYPRLIVAAFSMLMAETAHLTMAYFLSDMSTGVDVHDIVITATAPMIIFTVVGVIIVTLVYKKYIAIDPD